MFEAGQMAADVSPPQAKQNAIGAPKRDRRLSLTKIDRRGRLGRRVAELTGIFIAALGGELTPLKRMRVEKAAGEVTPLKLECIREAAQLKALAEAERGSWMRGESKCSLDELIRLERFAAAAVEELGLQKAGSAPLPKPWEIGPWQTLHADGEDK